MNILFHPHQQYVFLGMLAAGVIAGIVYDVFCVKRMLLGNSYAAVFVDDVLFSCIACIIYIAFTFWLNSGVIRWYGTLSFAVGFGIYKCTVSRIVIFFIKKLVDLIKRLLHFMLKLLLVPLMPFIAAAKSLFKFAKRKLKPLISLYNEQIMLIKIFNAVKDMNRMGKW